MSRLMSVALTEDAVRARTKTVTRRLGWWENKHGRPLLLPGDQLTLCRKVMGRRAGEPLVRIAEVRVFDIAREPVGAITDADVAREGFPGWTAAQFVEFFTREMKCTPDTVVTRIEWRYLGKSAPEGSVSR